MLLGMVVLMAVRHGMYAEIAPMTPLAREAAK
jgi:hypothetical protein